MDSFLFDLFKVFLIVLFLYLVFDRPWKRRKYKNQKD